jgi:hypothetical protein
LSGLHGGELLGLGRGPTTTDTSTTSAGQSSGLYGSRTGVNMGAASAAELVGTAILVLGGTARQQATGTNDHVRIPFNRSVGATGDCGTCALIGRS